MGLCGHVLEGLDGEEMGDQLTLVAMGVPGPVSAVANGLLSGVAGIGVVHSPKMISAFREWKRYRDALCRCSSRQSSRMPSRKLLRLRLFGVERFVVEEFVIRRPSSTRKWRRASVDQLAAFTLGCLGATEPL